MKKDEFKAVPGTRGYITENGVELVITHGDFAKLRKMCTVTNKSVMFQLQRANKALAYFEECLKQADNDLGPGSTKAIMLEEKIEDKRQEVEKLRPNVKKEYWGDNEDGTLSLPAGFWWMCENITNNDHLNTEVPYVPLPEKNGRTPRDYQIEVTKELLKHKRATCEMPTGTGKTVMISMVCNSMLEAKKRVCIIEPTVELVEQTTNAMKVYFDKVCAVGGGRKFKPGTDVCVTTVHSALENIDKFDAVLVDECFIFEQKVVTDKGPVSKRRINCS